MGRRLAELRDSKGLTQEQAADLLDVSHRTLQNWEAGENIPRGRNREKLAKLYGEPLRNILAGPTPRVEQDVQLWRIEVELSRQGEVLDGIADALSSYWATELDAAATRSRRRSSGTRRAAGHRDPAEERGR